MQNSLLFKRRTVQAIGLTLLSILLLTIIYYLRAIFNPLLLALILAYILNPIVNLMEKIKIRRSFAIFLIYLTLSIFIIIIFIFGIPFIGAQSRFLFEKTFVGDRFTDVNKNGTWDEGEPLHEIDVDKNGKYNPSYLTTLVKWIKTAATRWKQWSTSPSLEVSDIKDPEKLINILEKPNNSLVQYFREKMSPSTQKFMMEYKKEKDEEKKKELLETFLTHLVKDLNQIIEGPSIYKGREHFFDIKLSKETKKLANKKELKGVDLKLLNRLLIEVVFLEEIRKIDSSDTVEWKILLREVANKKGVENVAQTLFRLSHTTLRAVITTIMSIFAILTYLILLPIYTFFLLKGINNLIATAKSYMPPSRRDDMIRIFTRIHKAISSFFRGKLIVCFAKGLLTWLVLELMGVQFALLFGVIQAIASIIPFFVLIVGLGPNLLIVFIEGMPWPYVIGVILLYSVIEALEGFWLNPWIMGKNTGLHPLTVILSLMIGGYLLGFFGLLIAIPIATTLKILAEELLLPHIREFLLEDAKSMAPKENA